MQKASTIQHSGEPVAIYDLGGEARVHTAPRPKDKESKSQNRIEARSRGETINDQAHGLAAADS